MTAKNARPICGAKRKRGQGICRVTAIYQNGRCRVHGGPTPSGPDSANFQHGGYSKWGVLPKNLAEHYARTRQQSDTALMSLTDEIALIDARLSQLMGELEPAGTVKLWTEARTKLAAFKDAAARKTGVLESLAALETVIDAGANGSTNWVGIVELLEQRRKLVDTESKRRRESQEMISARQAMALVSYVAHAIREHVTDATARAKVFTSLQKVLKGNQAATIDVAATRPA